jgi:hypothetical protein
MKFSDGLWALFALFLLSFGVLWLIVLPFVGLYIVVFGGGTQ